MSSVDEVVAALVDGELVVIPTDTVYGLACRPDAEAAVRGGAAGLGEDRHSIGVGLDQPAK